MTVSSSVNRVEFTGNGATLAFPTTFNFSLDADLKVVLTDALGVETVQVITTNYTVTGAGSGSGGTVTMIVAPAAGESLVIIRDVAATQTIDYVANDPFPAETHEGGLDKLTYLSQQLATDLARALKLADGETDAGVDMTLSVSVGGYLNKLFGTDEAGKARVFSLAELLLMDAAAVVITGGTIDGTTIGGSTPAEGDFTELGVTGNVGIGVTLEAWLSTYRVLQIGGLGAIAAPASPAVSSPIHVLWNAYDTVGDGTFKRIANNEASAYTQVDGRHVFRSAVAGTPDVAFSFTDLLDIGISGVSGTLFLDEDDMASDSDAHLASQQSINARISAVAGGLTTTVIDIGDWNMDSTGTLTVAHGLIQADIRSVVAYIRPDSGAGSTLHSIDFINTSNVPNGTVRIDAANINLARVTSGDFNNTAYDATSYNRGWITITHV